MIGRRRFLQASVSPLAASCISACTGTGDSLLRIPGDGATFALAIPNDGLPSLARLRHHATNFDWARAGANIAPRITADGSRQTDWKLVSHTIEGSTVRMAYEAPNGLRCRQQISGVDDMPAWTSTTVFENSSITAHRRISSCGALRLPLRSTLGALQAHVLRRDKFAIERWPIDRVWEVSGGGWNSPLHAGLIAIEAVGHHEFLVVGVEWERGWYCRLGLDAGVWWLTVDLEDSEFALEPGATVKAPPVFMVMASGDIDDAVNAAHHFLKAHVFPAPRSLAPWVVYDFWATDSLGVEAATLAEIDFAAELGVELFYIDAAWYEGSSTRGTGDWGCGLGSYRDDRRKFPHGIAAISRRVHECGMKFGLWVAPNAVDRRRVPAEVPRRWIAQLNGAARILTIPEWEEKCLQVCLGCDEYVEHLLRNLTRIVGEFQLDWLKWDNSGIPGIPGFCNRPDHGHDAGGGSNAALRGEYQVLAALHRAFPDLVLEQCGYGSRQDLGRARIVRANWMSDATFPASHVRENALAARFVYPSFYNGGWIVRVDPELEKAKTPAHLDTLYRSRMLGLFGFGTLYGTLRERVSLLPPEVIAAGRRHIALYKSYRHLLRGDSYLLTPPAGNAERWQAVEFVGTAAPNAGRNSVVLCFRNGSTQPTMRFPLRGLESSASYTIASANASESLATTARVPRTLTGRELRDTGLLVHLADADGSDIIILKRAR